MIQINNKMLRETKKLYIKGYGTKKIAKKFNLAITTARNYLLKAGIAKEKVCATLLKYIALVRRNILEAKEVRGIIIANEFDSGLKLSVSNLPNIFLKKYNINFTFEDIK